MQGEEWAKLFGEPAAVDDLRVPAAAELVSFISRHAAAVAGLVEVRATQDRALIKLELQTGRPQRSAVAINANETIGLGFFNDHSHPTVFIMRDDFPDTPHQQLAIEGFPRAICIDDRPWAEARLTWTPAELLQRVLNWFERAADGRLHDPRQPLDPNFITTHLEFVISREILAQADDLDLIAELDNETAHLMRVRPAREDDVISDDAQPLCIAAYSIPPEAMRRLAFAPGNLLSVADMLSERGIDLLASLGTKFSSLMDHAHHGFWRIHSRFAVIVEMPILGPDGVRQPGTDLRAFVSDHTVGSVAAALGIAIPTSLPSEGSSVGFVKAIAPQPPDRSKLREITVQPAEIHYEFDRMLATQLAGRAEEDDRRVVVVGAGAIGSHVIECMAREGRFHWTIIDDDHVLPHNLARHTGYSSDVAKKKAKLLASFVDAIFIHGEDTARGIAANVMTRGAERAAIDTALVEADLIIDASASVLASRHICDHAAQGRRLSIFFNPRGDAVVLLVEPFDRSITLRELEAQYLRLLFREPRLASHLAQPDKDFAYTGACRAITNLIPESRVTALSGLVAAGLGYSVDQHDGVIRTWSMVETGAVEVFEVHPTNTSHYQARGWTISIDDDVIDRIIVMRRTQLPAETGGVLVGLVDIPAQRIHIVDAASAPPDSLSSPKGFTRGTHGVRSYLDSVFERTDGQLRYVGEWHSHPQHATTRPSAIDLVQLDWLSTLFDMEQLPALMLIAGDDGVSINFVEKLASASTPSDPQSLSVATGGS